MNTPLIRFKNTFLASLPVSRRTVWWLLKIIVPVSLGVSILQYYGIIGWIANLLEPGFSLIGLPGESAIVFITSFFLSLYAPIAIIATLPLDMREITILAVMCLITHNMIVETAVQKKTGSSAVIIILLRVGMSFVAAWFLNLLIPQNIGVNTTKAITTVFNSLPDMLDSWLISTGWLSLKITLIVSGLMLLQNILKEFRVLDLLSRVFAPVMKFFGLSTESSFLWFVSQIIGLTYGSAIMVEAVEQSEIKPRDAKLLNYHIAINHSMLEDTLLFVAIGVNAGWIMIPRLILAFLTVHFVKSVWWKFISKQNIE
jgi:spore maturation protein SpmB